MDKQMLDDRLEPIYNSSVLMQDVAWKTHRKRWMIKTSGERGWEKSVPTARPDDGEWQNSRNTAFLEKI